MISRTFSRTPLALGLTLAMLCMSTMVALAAPQQSRQSGELTVSGSVMVDGAKAISGATLFSDSTITTAENSSAIVTLNGLGRVELSPNSSLKLSFSEANVMGSLDAGRLRVSTQQGTMANISTKDGAVVASNVQPAAFTVDVECGNTAVATSAGQVELRSGSTVKQIAAGSQDTAGTAAPGTRCTRLTNNAAGIGGISGGALAALLIASAAAVGGALYAAGLFNDNDIETTPGGQVPVLSPNF